MGTRFMTAKVILLIGLIFGLFVFACRKDQAVEKKYDPALRNYLESSRLKPASTEWIPVLGKCSKEITDSLKNVLENAGARIGTVSGKLFTADIPKIRLKQVASLREVEYLQLSPKAKPVR
ncbi:hypothetical protein BMS3Abin05_01960 [bacterium BMS3Abin05]|nr:hypothetical protein BMS3Abin05_01960 [bacterium BMS3Abin05]GBE26504.1 hypothetical protein BMS3Bbin03_00417 [bacterium BMS3Bbin03]